MIIYIEGDIILHHVPRVSWIARKNRLEINRERYFWFNALLSLFAFYLNLLYTDIGIISKLKGIKIMKHKVAFIKYHVSKLCCVSQPLGQKRRFFTKKMFPQWTKFEQIEKKASDTYEGRMISI